MNTSATGVFGMEHSNLSAHSTPSKAPRDSDAARSETFFELLSTDLHSLAAEAKKLEGFSTQFAVIFHGKDAPNIKESCERALHHLRALAGVGRVTMQAVRECQDLVRPFHEACELKVSKLVCIALSSFQKFVSHDGVNAEGVSDIITSLIGVEKLRDEAVHLRILQTALAIVQNPMFADDEDGMCMVLGLVFRISAGNKFNPTVLSTAAATIRQAVALVFDHSLLPHSTLMASPTALSIIHTDMLGREAVALNLLSDIVAAAGGAPIIWLKTPPPSRTFLLDLLESILLWRSTVFTQIPQLTMALQTKVCNLLDGLLTSALDPNVDPGSLVDVRLTVRCCGAMLRRHTALAPEKCAHFLSQLIRACGPSRTPWQRIIVLQALRQLCADPMLLYALFEMYDLVMDYDLFALTDMVRALSDVVCALVQQTDDLDDDVVEGLPSLYAQKACGIDPSSELDSMGPVVPGAEIIICYLALECMLAVVTDIEVLTDQVMQIKVDIPAIVDRSAGGQAPELRPDVCLKLVDKLWRFLIASFAGVLSRTAAEPLIAVLLKGYQQFIYSAGTLGAIIPRDGFLASLCEYTLTSPEDYGPKRRSVAGSAQGTDGSSRKGGLKCQFSFFSFPHTMGKLLYTGVSHSAAIASLEGGGLALTAKNVAALRVLFNLAHRLNDVLSFSWIYVVDVINCLEQVLTSPYSSAQDRLVAEEHEDAVAISSGLNAPSELSILSSAVNQLFENTSSMSTVSVMSLLGALGEVSTRSLPVQARYGEAPLYSLNRMVDTLLHNLFRLQDLWGPILAHMLDLLRSPNSQVRSSAIEALDRAITGALKPAAAIIQHSSPTQTRGVKFSSSAPTTEEEVLWAHEKCTSQPVEDVQDMLMTALDSLYREERDLDVSRGLLKIIMHVLHHHGDELTRGWVPLLRLLEAVPMQADPSLITLGFQCIELIVSDFLPTMPKEYIPRTLDAVALFARQSTILNVSLTAVTMVWSLADQLARTNKPRPAATLTPSFSGPLGLIHDVPGSGTPDKRSSMKSPLMKGASGFAPSAVVPPPSTIVSTSKRQDISEAEVVEMVMTAFRSLKHTSMDDRPEVRNSSVRTLFLAVASHGGKLPGSTWQEVMWEMLFPLVGHIHMLSYTSSCEEVQASELGKERGGKSVLMLMHHSRNTEQKQWDETLVLALNGTTKVLRAHMLVLMKLDGFQKNWKAVMKLMGDLLFASRRGVATAATCLITTLVQNHANIMQPEMWRPCLQAIDKGVSTMASPHTQAPLMARTEMVTGIGTVYSALREQMGEEDVKMVLFWLDRFARYPIGLDDTAAMLTQLGPIQKAVLGVIGQLAPPAVASAWTPIMLSTCSTLCPFKVLKYRSSPPPPKPAPHLLTHSASTKPSHFPSSISPTRSLMHASSMQPSWATQPATSLAPSMAAAPDSSDQPVLHATEDPALEARALSALWMSRVCEQVTIWYKDHVPWQVRVPTFTALLSALADCMAMRHLHPSPPWKELWRTAARCFISVVEAGLPSINATSHGRANSIPEETWPLLVRAFRMFLLGLDLPSELDAMIGADAPPLAPEFGGIGSTMTSSLAGGKVATASAVAPALDKDWKALVLECLGDTVLPMCQYAPLETRQALVDIIDLGAAGPVLNGCDWAATTASTSASVHGPSEAQFSHECLSQLHVLCCRGQDCEAPREQSARCQLEVATLALPVFVSRCEVILRQLVQSAAPPSPLSSAPGHRYPLSASLSLGHYSSPPPSLDPFPNFIELDPSAAYRLERARLVVRLLSQLHVVPALTNHLVQYSHPQLLPWVEMARYQRTRLPGAVDASNGGLSKNSSFSTMVQRTASGSSEGSGGFGAFSSLLGTTATSNLSGPSHHRPRVSGGTGQGAVAKEQYHLLALYGVLCECVHVPDGPMREHVGLLMMRVGVELGFCQPLADVGGRRVAGASMEGAGGSGVPAWRASVVSQKPDDSCTLV